VARTSRRKASFRVFPFHLFPFFIFSHVDLLGLAVERQSLAITIIIIIIAKTSKAPRGLSGAFFRLPALDLTLTADHLCG